MRSLCAVAYLLRWFFFECVFFSYIGAPSRRDKLTRHMCTECVYFMKMVHGLSVCLATVVVFAIINNKQPNSNDKLCALLIQKVFMFYKFLGGWFSSFPLALPHASLRVPERIKPFLVSYNNFPCLISSVPLLVYMLVLYQFDVLSCWCSAFFAFSLSHSRSLASCCRFKCEQQHYTRLARTLISLVN